MTPDNREEMTILLNAAGAGDPAAPGRLLEMVYDDLRRLAAAYMSREREDHTLQATALVHEAFIRLLDWETVSWENRAQFFAVAAQVMRRVLVDHARTRGTQKRAGNLRKITLDEAVGLPDGRDFDILKLEEALSMLEKIDPRQAKIVELKFFSGLSNEEAAYVLNVSVTTVKREWTFAKAWFQRELNNQ